MDMEIDPPNTNPEVEIKDDDLFKAAESGDASTFESLSQNQLSKALSLRNEDGRSLLHVAASSSHPEVVKVLSAIDESASVINSADEEGWAPLHSAASIGNLEIVELYDIHCLQVGCTPLHRAASTGNSELCELLIEEGAEIDAVDKAGQTPLMNAVICYNKEVALLLIRHGADVDVEDKEGYTVLGRASADFRPILIDAAKAMLEG
ncbi:26s proteasome non-atpase regulatory subunit 10 [Quercus suber]|uniref:26s proteasome non-atpase regulatory subunit 10 n=1 Tax=Quercus suber TaxID=58331 RepID=A0AAW0LFY1_QUESU